MATQLGQAEPNHGNPWSTAGIPHIALAMLSVVEECLGPGKRGVVWVQGCLRRCRDCISPAWRELDSRMLVTPANIADALLAIPQLEGLTISGGEPMLQAAGLAEMIRLLRLDRDVSVLCFTGYTLQELRVVGPARGIAGLLAETDVLIDGPYIPEANDNRGLRGSSNQQVHFLTQRLSPETYDYAMRARTVEIGIYDGALVLMGVPPSGALESFRCSVGQAAQIERQVGLHRPNDGATGE